MTITGNSWEFTIPEIPGGNFREYSHFLDRIAHTTQKGGEAGKNGWHGVVVLIYGPVRGRCGVSTDRP